MVEKAEAVRQLRAALEHDAGVNLHSNLVDIGFADGRVVLTGEVETISAKRIAVRVVGALPFVTEVEDCLRLRPTQPRDDGAIKDGLVMAFEQEILFHACNLRVSWHEQQQLIGQLQGEEACSIDLIVCDGVVTLRGEVWSLSHCRLAEALCWWTPGVRDVVDEITVVPAEQDTDDEINDAVAMVLSKDPMVQADRLHVTTRDRVVTLSGVVRSSEVRRMVEEDCWYLSGVAGVVNKVQVTGGQGPYGIP